MYRDMLNAQHVVETITPAGMVGDQAAACSAPLQPTGIGGGYSYGASGFRRAVVRRRGTSRSRWSTTTR